MFCTFFCALPSRFLPVAGGKWPKFDPWDINVTVDQKAPYSFISNSLAG